MLQHKTLAFLADLKENNTTEWFKGHQASYLESKKDFELIVAKLIEGLGSFDNAIEKQDLQIKKCIKRIHRDTRFSNDKTPYKTNYFAIFNPGGHKSEHASYYMHVAPNNCFIGGGVYMPATLTLNKFRKEIEDHLEEWEALLNEKSFRLAFPDGIQSPSALKTVPKGFNKESAAIAYIRMKGFYTMRAISDQAITSESAIPNIIQGFQKVRPLIEFLNRALHS